MEHMTQDYDRIFELIWENYDDGSNDGLEATTLDEALWTIESIDGPEKHPWSHLFFGYTFETHCTYRQTLETPAEYETRGRLWVTDGEGRELADVNAGEFQ